MHAELAFERFYPQRPAAPAPWRLAEAVPGPTTERFCRKARELGVVAVLNLYERNGRNAFDEWLAPTGGVRSSF